MAPIRCLRDPPVSVKILFNQAGQRFKVILFTIALIEINAFCRLHMGFGQSFVVGLFLVWERWQARGGTRARACHPRPLSRGLAPTRCVGLSDDSFRTPEKWYRSVPVYGTGTTTDSTSTVQLYRYGTEFSGAIPSFSKK